MKRRIRKLTGKKLGKCWAANSLSAKQGKGAKCVIGRLPSEMSLIKVAALCEEKQEKEMRDPIPALADATGKSPCDLISCRLDVWFSKLG